jgi:hypothetical protein
VIVRAFLLGVLATIVVAAVCGYIVLRSGLVPANADADWRRTGSKTIPKASPFGK